MFGHTYKRLTEASHHYIDWSRFGELLVSAKHRYHGEELLVRGSIVAFTAASGLIGAYLNNEEKTYCGDLTVALASGLLGFVVSHAVAIYPLIHKRIQMSRDCDTLVASILNRVDSLDPDVRESCRVATIEVIEEIYTLSLSNDKHANASLTWGTRKHLFEQLDNKLAESEYDSHFWARKPRSMIKHLQQSRDQSSANDVHHSILKVN